MTTIHTSDILEGYRQNFLDHGHLDDVEAIVIADRKTPGSVYDACEILQQRGLRACCVSVDQQEEYLRKFGNFARLIPHDSDNRRNVGYLMALDRGAQFIISLDDDNFCLPETDVYEEHCVVCGATGPLSTVESDTGWYNICERLQLEPPVRVYPRGFPYRSRHRNEVLRTVAHQGRIAVNAGLWLSEPDLDGMTWLIAPVRALSAEPESIVLGPHTWSPINSQNTAIRNDAAQSYYFARMGYRIDGMGIDRYGDIFSGYFALACANHMGEFVKFGSPLATHRRNSHNYLRDAAAEFPCIWVLEDVIEWLHDVRLQGTTYLEAYAALSWFIEDAVHSFHGSVWTDATRGYIHLLAYHMREWLTCCRQIGVR